MDVPSKHRHINEQTTSTTDPYQQARTRRSSTRWVLELLKCQLVWDPNYHKNYIGIPSFFVQIFVLCYV